MTITNEEQKRSPEYLKTVLQKARASGDMVSAAAIEQRLVDMGEIAKESAAATMVKADQLRFWASETLAKLDTEHYQAVEDEIRSRIQPGIIKSVEDSILVGNRQPVEVSQLDSVVERVHVDIPVEAPAVKIPGKTRAELEDMTNKDLIAYAFRTFNVSLSTGMGKDNIIQVITKMAEAAQ
jgi:hypothetical protein